MPDPILYPHLKVVNLGAEAAASTSAYRNVVINRVNDSCLRLAVFEGEYRWHRHTRSDELFLVMEGELEIELANGTTLRLGPWDVATVPAGTVHRTRAIGRTVNLCFEHLAADTTFVDAPTG